jgi:hypothetical protein
MPLTSNNVVKEPSRDASLNGDRSRLVPFQGTAARRAAVRETKFSHLQRLGTEEIEMVAAEATSFSGISKGHFPRSASSSICWHLQPKSLRAADKHN